MSALVGESAIGEHPKADSRHDERDFVTVVVECDAERAAKAKVWVEKAMIEGIDTVLSGMDEAQVPVEVEVRIARSWGKEISLRPGRKVLRKTGCGEEGSVVSPRWGAEAPDRAGVAAGRAVSPAGVCSVT